MTTEEALKMLEKTNKIDTLGVTNPGRIIDLHNQLLTAKKEKEMSQLVTDMNHYYFKLIIDTMEKRANGDMNPVFKSNSILVS